MQIARYAYNAEASARHQFERPAQDLVSLLNISNAEMILDVGSGTGMVASAVSRSIGPSHKSGRNAVKNLNLKRQVWRDCHDPFYPLVYLLLL